MKTTDKIILYDSKQMNTLLKIAAKQMNTLLKIAAKQINTPQKIEALKEKQFGFFRQNKI